MAYRCVESVWAEISLDNIAHNTREAKRLVKSGTIIMGILKADGYGHGAVHVGNTVLDNGADRFGVATLAEAIELRNAGYSVPILILSYTPPDRFDDIVRYDLTQTVYRYEQALLLSIAAKRREKIAKIHIKIDTGMNRLGFIPCEDSIVSIDKIQELSNVAIEGAYTHFAKAYEVNKAYTYAQMEKFNWMMGELEKRGIVIPIKHVSNSAAVTDLPEYNLDMVRIGSILYGLPHRPNLGEDIIDLRPAMTVKSRISNLKMLPQGVGISYGHTYITSSERRIATLPMGYVDGITRIGSNKIQALVGGCKVPQVGTICMDQCMLDVTSVASVDYDDEVILLGSDGANEITADDKANILGTGNCEIVCAVGRRVPRLYIFKGKEVGMSNYLVEGCWNMKVL